MIRRRWAAFRPALRIARRDAARAKGRTALVAVMIGLPVLVGSTGGVLVTSAQPTPARYVSWHLGDEVQARIGPFEQPGLEQDARGEGWGYSGVTALEAPSLAEHEELLAAALPPGDRLIRTVSAMATVASASAAPSDSLEVAEVPLDEAALMWLAPLSEGSLPSGVSEVALGAASADRLHVGVGDRVTVTLDRGGSVDATVTGLLRRTVVGPQVVAPAGSLIDPPTTAANGSPWARWYVVGAQPVTWTDVVALNALGSVVTSRAVVLDPPAAAQPDPTVAEGTVTLGVAVAAMALLEAILLIGPAFAVGARRSERHLALMVAAGAERATLRQVVLLGGVVIGSTASLVGLVGGVGLAATIRVVEHLRGGLAFPDLRIPAELPLLLVLGTVIATAAAWVPARRAARVDVVAALAGRRSEARPRRRVALLGVALFGVGAAAALGGAVTSRPTVLVAGVLALEVGLITASGGLVSAVGALAPWAGVAGRLALRDADRQRARTAPAVAAVIAAMAGVVAGAVYLESRDQQQESLYTALAADGTVAVSFNQMHGPVGPVGEVADGEVPDTTAVREAIGSALPVTDVHQVSVLDLDLDLDLDLERAPDGGDITLSAVRPPEQVCPLTFPSVASLTEDEVTEAYADPRCSFGRGGTVLWMAPGSWGPTLVDDGTVIEALGLPGSAAAAEALRDGRVVVRSEYELWVGGTAHLQLASMDPQTSEVTEIDGLVVPATAVDLEADQQYAMVVPPSVAQEMGLRVAVAGLVATTSRAPTQAEEDAATLALAHAAPGASLYVERGFRASSPLELLILLVAAVVVGVGATGIAVALAAAESRPDLATLAAVGASPGLRRRFAAAQAGVISVVGAGLGVVTGLMLGRVLVVAEQFRYDQGDFTWQVVTPWPAVMVVGLGVPVLAMAGAFVLTRSRPPMVRRVVG